MAADKTFEVYLIERGVISQADFLMARGYQRSNSITLPQLCMDKGLLDVEAVQKIRDAAFRTNKSFAEAAISTKLVDQQQMAKIQQLHAYKKVTIEDALLQLKLIGEGALDEYRDKYDEEFETSSFSDLDVDLSQTSDSDVVTELFKTSCDFFIKPDQAASSKTYPMESKVDHKALPHCVSQKLTGQMNFTFYVFSSEKLWLDLTEEFFMIPFEEYGEDAEESSKEIMNTINGNACCRLSQSGIEESLDPAEYHKTEDLFKAGAPTISLFPRVDDFQAGYIIHDSKGN
jgi:hypothetical protein